MLIMLAIFRRRRRKNLLHFPLHASKNILFCAPGKIINLDSTQVHVFFGTPCIIYKLYFLPESPIARGSADVALVRLTLRFFRLTLDHFQFILKQMFFSTRIQHCNTFEKYCQLSNRDCVVVNKTFKPLENKSSAALLNC